MSVIELSKIYEIRTPQVRTLIRSAISETHDALVDPEGEVTNDVWRMRVMGSGQGNLDFRKINQPWLRESVKGWAGNKLPQVDQNSVRRVIAAVTDLSLFLSRRDDRGLNPAALDRSQALAYLTSLHTRYRRGLLTSSQVTTKAKSAGQFLREAREYPISRDRLSDLPAEFTITSNDTKRFDYVRADERRDLPQVVLDQLLSEASLAALEEGWGRTTRALVEIQAAIGRRTIEASRLRWNCLEYDAPSEPVVVLDLAKGKKRKDFRLPISTETADLIRAQQQWVRNQFPKTPTAKLALFPQRAMNPHGTKPYTSARSAKCVRDWVDSLPEIQDPDGGAFPKERVVPYAFRHSYAQRHADAGTDIDVLRELMGHSTTEATEGYYVVADQRKRRAIDLLEPFQVIAPTTTGDTAESLIASAQMRRAIGDVAVPFGRCTEPSNVKAKGKSCPYRFRCGGCDHFRTDPSYLPELRAQLQQLLKDRERLSVTLPDLADWARQDAIPSEDEISVFRRLIASCEEKLETVDDETKTIIEESITILRRTRANRPVGGPDAVRIDVRQVKPTINPRVNT